LHYPTRHIVITGGEPFIYDLTELSNILKKRKFFLQVETNGTLNITGLWDWIVFSPKPNSNPLQIFFDIANELKIIITSDEDFKWAKYCEKKINPKAFLFVQPEWSKFNENIEKIIFFLKENPNWFLSLQLHKFINIP